MKLFNNVIGSNIVGFENMSLSTEMLLAANAQIERFGIEIKDQSDHNENTVLSVKQLNDSKKSPTENKFLKFFLIKLTSRHHQFSLVQ